MSRRPITRAKRAANLLAAIEHGPSFVSFSSDKRFELSADHAAKVYRLWAQTWIVDELRDLLRIKPAPDLSNFVLGQCTECCEINRHSESCSRKAPIA